MMCTLATVFVGQNRPANAIARLAADRPEIRGAQVLFAQKPAFDFLENSTLTVPVHLPASFVSVPAVPTRHELPLVSTDDEAGGF